MSNYPTPDQPSLTDGVNPPCEHGVDRIYFRCPACEAQAQDDLAEIGRQLLNKHDEPITLASMADDIRNGWEGEDE
jgi:hypothetical protein